MTWEDYLRGKKISPEQFDDREPERYRMWRQAFEQMHPESFTTQKKFLLNELRRKYLIR